MRLVRGRHVRLEADAPTTLYLVMTDIEPRRDELALLAADPTAIVVNWSDKGWPVSGGGQSTLVATHVRQCNQYADPLLLPSLKRHIERAPASPSHLLTFSGTIYVKGEASYRMDLLPLHRPEYKVHVVGKCRDSDSQRWRFRSYCARIRSRFDAHRDFAWSDTRFGLVPGGQSPMSYRLAETILAGIIPVIVIPEDAILPRQIPWLEMSFRFSPEQAHLIVPTLRNVSDTQYTRMRKRLSDWEGEARLETILMRALEANSCKVRRLRGPHPTNTSQRDRN